MVKRVDFSIAVYGNVFFKALMNPLQALFNSLVYRRWTVGSERLVLPWRRPVKSDPQTLSPTESVESSASHESLPLLQNVPRIGINGYTNYR